VGVAVEAGQQLTLRSWSNTAITLRAFVNFRPRDGGRSVVLIVDSVTTGDRLTSTGFLRLETAGVIDGVGWTFVSGSGTDATQRGQCFGQLFILSGVTLCAGYVYRGHGPPLGILEDPGPAGGHGMIKTITLNNPAAGFDFATQAVPAGSIWKWRTSIGQLITAVAVANREFAIKLADGINNVGGSVASEIQTASLTEDYYGSNPALSSGISAGLGTGVIGIGISDMNLPAGYQLSFKTFNLQAADQWTAASGFITVEEWVVPN